VPAPLMKVAEMTFPVDPGLKERAEHAARNLSHDLPLTVNDEVLSFLNSFRPRAAAPSWRPGYTARRSLPRDDSRVLQEEGMPQDLIYLAHSESAFRVGAVASGARGIWQFVAWRGNEYAYATPGGWTNGRSRESHPRGSPPSARSLFDVRRLVSSHGGLQLRTGGTCRRDRSQP